MKEQKYDSGIKIPSCYIRESDNAQVLHGRGQYIYEKDETEKVIESYDDTLNINPDYINALNSKVNALFKLNKKSFYCLLKLFMKFFLKL